VNLADLNNASKREATRALLACCDVPTWAEQLVEGRPYADAQSLLDRAEELAQGFSDLEVERALAAHPRIGERALGVSTEAAWSRQEQSGVSADAHDELGEVNRAYEERFGRVFLICASGLTAEEILDSARRRLQNDDLTESAVVAVELRKIALLRLRKVLDGRP
jgi:2-oxo-4-hydroxy-4-carboxy-5-ureidoimidazoline decarboxylase